MRYINSSSYSSCGATKISFCSFCYYWFFVPLLNIEVRSCMMELSVQNWELHRNYINACIIWCSLPLSYSGISLKTQELYALVFATRYLDLFTDYISLYNTLMKLIFLVSSFSIVWYIRHHKIVRRSYDKDQDTFRHYFLVLPCFLLALVINEKFTVKEVLRLPHRPLFHALIFIIVHG